MHFSAPGAQAAQQGQDQDTPRFLYDSLPEENRQVMWRLLTNAPGEELYKNLDKLAEIDANLHNVVNQALFGSNGVYYALTARCELDELEYPSNHIAQLIIYENKFDRNVGGKSHLIKARGCAAQLENVLEKLGIKEDALHKKFKAQKALLKIFIDYIDLHWKCMQVALNIVDEEENAGLNNSPCKPSAASAASNWNPGPLMNSTPARYTSPAKKARSAYQSSIGGVQALRERGEMIAQELDAEELILQEPS